MECFTLGRADSHGRDARPGRSLDVSQAVACRRRMVAALGCAVVNGLAAEPPGDGVQNKHGYTLWKPTPPALMRELITDRPDRTETPYTVDAGHAQVEMDLVGYTIDRHNADQAPERFEQWKAGPINLRLGLLNWLDAGIVWEPYVAQRIEDESTVPTTSIRRSGIGDLALRFKSNLWGNDGGATALALLPQLKFPTSTEGIGNDFVEGGVLVPFEVELPHGLSLGFNSGAGVFRNDADEGWHAEFVNSVALGYPLSRRVTGYVEFWSLTSTEDNAEWEGAVGLGVNYLVHRNLKFDAGVNIGVTRATDDLNSFIGVSWRL